MAGIIDGSSFLLKIENAEIFKKLQSGTGGKWQAKIISQFDEMCLVEAPHCVDTAANRMLS